MFLAVWGVAAGLLTVWLWGNRNRVEVLSIDRGEPGVLSVMVGSCNGEPEADVVELGALEDVALLAAGVGPVGKELGPGGAVILEQVLLDTVLELLDKLNRDLEKTIVMVTHDPKAAACAHKTLHLDKGRIDRVEENRGGATGEAKGS